MKRRPYGTGSLTQRRGSWFGQWRVNGRARPSTAPRRRVLRRARGAGTGLAVPRGERPPSNAQRDYGAQRGYGVERRALRSGSRGWWRRARRRALGAAAGSLPAPLGIWITRTRPTVYIGPSHARCTRATAAIVEEVVTNVNINGRRSSWKIRTTTAGSAPCQGSLTAPVVAVNRSRTPMDRPEEHLAASIDRAWEARQDAAALHGESRQARRHAAEIRAGTNLILDAVAEMMARALEKRGFVLARRWRRGSAQNEPGAREWRSSCAWKIRVVPKRHGLSSSNASPTLCRTCSSGKGRSRAAGTRRRSR
jgi:hypothetical protein